jgi:hypothetical protein
MRLRQIAPRQITVDALENLEKRPHTHLEAGFLGKFASHPFDERLAGLEHSSRDGPPIEQRRTAAPYQQHAAGVNDHAADTHDRTIGIFALLGHVSRHTSLAQVKRFPGAKA